MRTDEDLMDLITSDSAGPTPLEGGGSGEECDIFLAYSDGLSLRMAGFLVCRKDDIDSLVAFCPIASDKRSDSKILAREVLRQLRIARRVARAPEQARGADDILWLGNVGDDTRPVPHWVYGLNCMPLTREWDGRFIHPRPFCPVLFEAMVRQVRAVAWLTNQTMPEAPLRHRAAEL